MFIVSPCTVITIGAPFISKDPPKIWAANLALLVASYAYGYLFGRGEGATEAGGFSGVLQYLDFGSGQERGIRGAARERFFSEKEITTNTSGGAKMDDEASVESQGSKGES